MPQKQTHDRRFWFAIGLAATLLTAPNMTILKILVSDIEPLTLNTIRYAILAIISLPFVITAWWHFTATNLRYALTVGLCLAVSVTTTVYALLYSQASYVVILALLAPIILVLYSRHFIGEKVNFRAAAGITLAAIGAFTAVALPIALSGSDVIRFYPLATILILINCLLYPLAIIYSRKSHEAGLPLPAVYGVSSVVVLLASAIAMLLAHGIPTYLVGISPASWLGIGYSAIVVAFLARIMSTASYEKIGAVTTGALSYAHTIIAILIPVAVLGEQLSLAMVGGGLLILLGVYLTERHHTQHHKHRHFLEHH